MMARMNFGLATSRKTNFSVHVDYAPDLRVPPFANRKQKKKKKTCCYLIKLYVFHEFNGTEWLNG